MKLGKRIKPMPRNFTSILQSPYLRVLKIAFIGIGLACFLTSCIVSRHPYSIISASKPISSNYVVLGAVEESSCSPWFLLIPLGGKTSSDEIMTRLIKENGADALVGVTVEHKESLFSIPIMGSECTIVTGQAVRAIR